MPRSMGPRPPQLPHAWSLMGKMMMKPFQGTLYPYDPISGHTSRCTTGSWRTPCQAPSSRPSRSPRPCKRANGSPSTSIYGSKWDVSYLSIIYIYTLLWFHLIWPQKKLFKNLQSHQNHPQNLIQNLQKSHARGIPWAAALFPRLARSPLIPRACSWRSAVS